MANNSALFSKFKRRSASGLDRPPPKLKASSFFFFLYQNRQFKLLLALMWLLKKTYETDQKILNEI